jgi:hypothetical protein
MPHQRDVSCALALNGVPIDVLRRQRRPPLRGTRRHVRDRGGRRTDRRRTPGRSRRWSRPPGDGDLEHPARYPIGAAWQYGRSAPQRDGAFEQRGFSATGPRAGRNRGNAARLREHAAATDAPGPSRVPAHGTNAELELGEASSMEITIVGTGNMARGIATRLLAGGHSVTLLGTEKAKAEAVAAELSGDVRARQVGDRLAGDVVVLAVWFPAVDDVIWPLRRSARRQGRRRHHQPHRRRRLRAAAAGRGLGRPGDRRQGPGRQGRQGVQHDVRRDAPGRPGRRTAAGRPDRLRRRGRQADRERGRRRRRPAPDRRGTARARGARIPAHGDLAVARDGLRRRGQGARLTAP